jgi:glycosyltransferase involved in cell wall biosynthesis
MRILFTATALPPSIGGVQTHVDQVARQLAGAHAVQLVGHWDGQRTDWLRGSTVFAPPSRHRDLDGISVDLLGMPLGRRLRMLPWMATYYAQTRRAADRLAHLILGQLSAVARPVDIIHNHRVGREFLSLASERLARRLGVPFVLTPHHHPRWTGRRYRNYLALYRRADLVCVMTQVEARAMQDLGVDAGRLLVVGNAPHLAAEPNGPRFRERFGLADFPVVLFLGQKYEYKGIGTLLASAPAVWARHPHTRFLFVGPPTSYSRRVLRNSDARVVELPAVSLQEKSDALAAADILCVPSAQEALGIAYLEAWTLGKPVVGGRIPALAEVIADERDGLLVAPGNPAELSAALTRLLESAALRRELGERGREKVLARYSWSRCAALLAEAYERLRRAVPHAG